MCVCVCSVTQLCPTLCDPMDCNPARLLCPWNFPGKNIGTVAIPSPRDLSHPEIEPESPACPELAGRFLTTSTTWEAKSTIKWKLLSLVRLFVTPWTNSPWNSPGQNTGVGSLSLLQGIFPTQGSNAGLPHCRWILYQLSHKGSPRILEWAFPFSSGSFWPRNQTRVFCIVGRFFTNWATRDLNFKNEINLETVSQKVHG